MVSTPWFNLDDAVGRADVVAMRRDVAEVWVGLGGRNGEQNRRCGGKA
jgi:hypothetical protein